MLTRLTALCLYSASLAACSSTASPTAPEGVDGGIVGADGSLDSAASDVGDALDVDPDSPERSADVADSRDVADAEVAVDAGPVTDPPGAITKAGTPGPSCAADLRCHGSSCCDSRLVPASTSGALPMGRSDTGSDRCPDWDGTCPSSSNTQDEQPEHPAVLSDFYIDTFEVTVDRFRAFVDAYPGSKPVAGAGAHPKIGGSGWDASWPLPADSAALVSAISCVDSSTGAPVHTWTTLSGSAKKNHPINCVDWYVAFAFCAWDHGRLPTEAEWEYAAAGGSENRLLPWGLTDEPDCSYMTCGTDPLSVGSSLAGTSRWAQRDMSGNVWEWVLDSYAFKYTSSTCTDCANTAFDSSPGGIFRPRVIRGGGVIAGSHTDARAAARSYTTVGMLGGYLGFRCARDL